MRPIQTDQDSEALLRLDEILRTLPTAHFGLKQMKRSISMCVLYAFAVFCMSKAETAYQTLFLFAAVLTIVFTIIDDYDRFARERIKKLLVLMKAESNNENRA
jgi:hypothetical protein